MTSLQNIFLRIKNIPFPTKSFIGFLFGVLVFTATSIFAAPPLTQYAPGETLDPTPVHQVILIVR
ncbi:MAG: hypothetical protein KBC22_02405 [Candidatus Pacebacteria bacterium]|nr:hypothetical protein [Candidatus Paceibacterota bacterium]